MGLSGLILGLIDIGIVVIALLLVGAIILMFCNWMECNLEAARAAIEAMREPTDEMLNTLSSPEAWDSYDRGMAKARHLMMIDAALKD